MAKKISWTIVIGLLVIGLLGAAFVSARALLPDGAAGEAPSVISYQGYLEDDLGQPLEGTVDLAFGLYAASSGGTALWEEAQTNVAVSGGYFSVHLGSMTPLNAADFDAPTRYLQVSVDSGSGPVVMPRQQFTAVPYAYQAEQASSVPWSGISDVPAGVGAVANRLIVAQSGGDFTSVAAALNSITDAAVDNPYVVQVMPGEYMESNLVVVKEYVHLQGAGPNATIIVSSRTGSSPNNAAATVDLLDNGRISDLTVINEGTGTYGIALYSAETSRDAEVDNVVARAIGVGGTGHYAAYWNDAEAIIRNSTLFAGGAVGFGTAVNAAFGSVNIGGGFPQALIENSTLMGGSANNAENCNDPSGTGFGLQLSNSSPTVRGSYVCGGHRGVAVYTNGHAQFQNSSIKVSSTGSAFLFEISASGSIKVANSGVSYIGNKFTGAGSSGLSCAHAYSLGTYATLTDAINSSATACN